MGTLNLITAGVRARAVAEARSGRTVSIARPMPTSPILAGPAAPLGAPSIGLMQAALFTGTPQVMATLRSTAISLLHLTGITQITRTIQGISCNPARALELMPL